MAHDKRRLYFSSDCETTGSTPGIHRVLSIGTVVLDIDKTLLGVFTANLQAEPREGWWRALGIFGAHAIPTRKHVYDARTMAWWAEHQEAWERNTKNPQPPKLVMQAFNAFVREVQQRFPGKAIPSAYPASFDAKWYQYLAEKYAGEDLLGHSWECIKSVAAGHFGKPFDAVSKYDFPDEWSEHLKLTHIGVEDAFQQGAELINLHRARFGLPYIDGIRRHPDLVFVDMSDVTRPLLRSGTAPEPPAGKQRLVHPVLAGLEA